MGRGPGLHLSTQIEQISSSPWGSHLSQVLLFMPRPLPNSCHLTSHLELTHCLHMVSQPPFLCLIFFQPK